MSHEIVELLRKGIDAWNRREAELWLDYAAPDIEWIPAGPAAVERAIHRAYEEVAAGFSSTWGAWERFEFEESEMRDSGDSVLWRGRVKMRGSASHVELDQEFAVHGLVRDGELISIPTFLSWHEALEALGLAGWTPSRIWIEWVLADGRETRGWTRLAAVRPTGERPVISC